jgi:fluoroquinolone transport system permease protein
MKTLLLLSRQDFTTTFRDPVFKGLLVFPLVAFFALVRWVLPPVVQHYPPVGSYQTVILMWACLQSATMFGFIYGFLFLDEKEEHVFLVLRVVPVSTFRLLASRLLVGFLVSSFVNVMLLHFGGIVRLPWWQEVLLAAHFSLMAPLMAVVLGAFAKNKVEGMAQMKVINLLFILPGLIYFLPQPFVHLTALVPTYWSFRSLETAGSGADFFFYFWGGIGYYALLLLGVNRIFQGQIAE